ncbi:hypothetical protein FQA39_LY14027 [Lamprigera yunnana]|nr:hypothetical protein FQA39_LY14027 [Lamprigera yunnana]
MFRTLTRVVPKIVNKSNFNYINVARNATLMGTTSIPKVQGEAPYFKGTAVVNDSFKDISLTDYKDKYVVLVFYPLDFTFVCPTELIAFDEQYENFQKLNAEVIGISVDSHFTHLGWMNTKKSEGGLGKLRYPLLSDLNKVIAKDYNVLIEKDGIALRGLFIIDPKGIIRHMSINDLPIGRSVDETLRLIEAIQFVEKHGEVCPANWKRGDKTIKPDPEASKEYFVAANK